MDHEAAIGRTVLADPQQQARQRINAAAFLLWGLLSFVVLAIPPVDWWALAPQLLLSSGGIAWSFRRLYSLRRERLELDAQVLQHQDLDDAQELPFDEITSARWIAGVGGGRLILAAPAMRTTIHFDRYSAADRLWLIEQLRNAVPADRQSGWPEFCRRVALPLSESNAASLQRRTRAGSVLVTRARIDRLFQWSAGLSLVPSLCVAAVAENPKYALAPLLLVIPWFVLRARTPQTGRLSPAFFAQPTVRRIAWRLTACGGLLLAGLVCGSTLGRIVLTHAVEASLAAYVAGATGLAATVMIEQRRRRLQQREGESSAVLAWEQRAAA